VLSKFQKRLMLIYVDIIFSMLIWNINASWGNNFETCFILSTTTFLIVFTPFEIYWSFRDMWFDRWVFLKSKKIEIKKVNIEIKGGKFLRANLLTHTNNEGILSKNAIIVVCHGFSDVKETLQYLSYPFALQGYDVLTYDARGTGKSKHAGKRSDFINRIEDYKKIIEWIKTDQELSKKRIYTIGIIVEAVKNELSEDKWKNFSKKVYLIHSRNDRVIKFKNLTENILILNSPLENQLILKKGGHSMKKNEIVLVGASLKFFNS